MSAGVALIVRTGLAVSDVNNPGAISDVHPSSRWNAWLIEAGPPGCMMVISLYLRDSIGPWHPGNAKVLEQIRLVIRAVGRPFLVAGDWNAEPDDIDRCGFVK